MLDLQLTRQGDQVVVTCAITNRGALAGAEVVQCYVGDDQAAVARPARELKAFRKVRLAAGERASVTFTLDPRAFSYWDEGRNDWYLEPGVFTIAVGSSSRDLRLTATCLLN